MGAFLSKDGSAPMGTGASFYMKVLKAQKEFWAEEFAKSKVRFENSKEGDDLQMLDDTFGENRKIFNMFLDFCNLPNRINRPKTDAKYRVAKDEAFWLICIFLSMRCSAKKRDEAQERAILLKEAAERAVRNRLRVIDANRNYRVAELHAIECAENATKLANEYARKVRAIFVKYAENSEPAESVERADENVERTERATDAKRAKRATDAKRDAEIAERVVKRAAEILYEANSQVQNVKDFGNVKLAKKHVKVTTVFARKALKNHRKAFKKHQRAAKRAARLSAKYAKFA